MKNQVLIFSLLYLLFHGNISAQNTLFPIERSEDFLYENVMLRDTERVVFTTGYSYNTPHYIDVFSNDGSYFSIDKPKSISDWGHPFYYNKISDNSITTGWVYGEADSFSIIMTNYDPLDETHKIINKKSLPGVLKQVIYTNIKKHKDNDYVILSLSSGGASKQILLLRIDESGMFHIQSLSLRPPGVVTEGLFLLLHVKEFDILNDNRLLLRGHFATGIAITDFNLEIIDHRYGDYEDTSRGRRFNSWSYGWFENGTRERWVFGLGIHKGMSIFGPNMIVYHVEMDKIIIDTGYVYSNPENFDRAVDLASLVKLGNNDVLTCNNPFNGVDWKTPFSSEVYFKRIQDKEEIWHKKFESEHFVRVKDMVLVDSCEVMIVGSIFDYFNNGYLQGFYATFDCDGNLITSNIDLKEVDLNIYPNPSDGLVTVEIEDWKDLDYSVYTIDGRLVQSGMLDGQKADLSQIKNGTYVLKITTPDGIVNQKLVISN